MNNLIKFINSLPIKSEIKLPIFHTCTYEEALVHIEAGKITPAMCDVNETELTYMFLGKARFARESPNRNVQFSPIGFVFKPNATVKIYRIFPFDTGAVKLGRYDPIITKDQMEKVNTEFYIGDEILNGYKLINFFFKDLKDYIVEKPIQFSKEELEEFTLEGVFALQEISDVYTNKYTRSDGRRVTFELQLKEEVKLNDNQVSHVLLPMEKYEKTAMKSWCQTNAVKPVFYAENLPDVEDLYYNNLITYSIQLALKDVA
jgi:hypothetical protein